MELTAEWEDESLAGDTTTLQETFLPLLLATWTRVYVRPVCNVMGVNQCILLCVGLYGRPVISLQSLTVWYGISIPTSNIEEKAFPSILLEDTTEQSSARCLTAAAFRSVPCNSPCSSWPRCLYALGCHWSCSQWGCSEGGSSSMQWPQPCHCLALCVP